MYCCTGYDNPLVGAIRVSFSLLLRFACSLIGWKSIRYLLKISKSSWDDQQMCFFWIREQLKRNPEKLDFLIIFWRPSGFCWRLIFVLWEMAIIWCSLALSFEDFAALTLLLLQWLCAMLWQQDASSVKVSLKLDQSFSSYGLWDFSFNFWPLIIEFPLGQSVYVFFKCQNTVTINSLIIIGPVLSRTSNVKNNPLYLLIIAHYMWRLVNGQKTHLPQCLI